MRVHYTGRKADISDKQKQKLQVKFDKIHRILSPKDSLEAHVILSRQRHLCEAEVTLRALSHTLVVTATNAEPLAALLAAVDKLSKQAVKNKHKLIDVRRHERQHGERSPTRETTSPETTGEEQKLRRHGENHRPQVIRSRRVAPKPLTIEEAVMELDDLDRDQITFRDAESGAVRVLLRRRDGDLELVETG